MTENQGQSASQEPGGTEVVAASSHPADRRSALVLALIAVVGVLSAAIIAAGSSLLTAHVTADSTKSQELDKFKRDELKSLYASFFSTANDGRHYAASIRGYFSRDEIAKSSSPQPPRDAGDYKLDVSKLYAANQSIRDGYAAMLLIAPESTLGTAWNIVNDFSHLRAAADESFDKDRNFIADGYKTYGDAFETYDSQLYSDIFDFVKKARADLGSTGALIPSPNF